VKLRGHARSTGFSAILGAGVAATIRSVDDLDIHIHFPAHQVLFHLAGQLHLGLVVERRRRQVFIVDFDGDGAGVVLELVRSSLLISWSQALQHHGRVIGGSLAAATVVTDWAPGPV
jgi:hypothetical protein